MHPELMHIILGIFLGCFHLDYAAGFTGKHQPVCEEFTFITTAARTSSGEPSRK